MRNGPWGERVGERLEAALDELTRRLRTLEGVIAAIVFGSYARGEASRTSDLDVLILLRVHTPEERAENERLVARAAVDVEVGHRLPVRIAPLIGDADRPDTLGSSLLHEIWRDGICLYGTTAALAAMVPGGLSPWDVLRFSLPGVPPRDRVRLARRLHGLRGRPGVLRYPGLDLARGAALVPADQGRAVRAALDDAGATYDVIPVWRES